MESSSYKTTVKTAWTLERSRKITVLLIALMSPNLSQSGCLVSANTIGATSLAALPITSPPMLPGSFQVVSSGFGDQINPHVDCNLASYTNDTGGSAEIRYFDFNTSTDQAIPVVGVSFLSDVSGTTIAYTNVSVLGSRIGVYNTATNTTMFVPDGNHRTNPSIGGNTVAFEDRGFSSNPNESEIVVYNLSTGTTTRLTNDALMDTNPKVSPNGDVVVFQKCQTNGFGCDIYVSTQTAPDVWTTQPITGAAGEDTNPHTNGIVVAYSSTRSGETDIFYQPVTGGTEIQLALPGDQRNATVSGNLIAFESQVGTEYDILLYNTATGHLYQVTDTPVDETLNDITVCGDTARIVYSAAGPNGDFDLFAFNFTPPNPVIVAATPTLVNESCPPANGAIDPGENVSVNFTLTNTGNVSTSNLVATLQPSANVIAPSGPQSFGVVAPGATATRTFSFTANGSSGDGIPLTLALTDDATALDTVTFTATLGSNTSCTQARLVVTSNIQSLSQAGVVVNITVQNQGITTANNVTLTQVTLGAANGSPLPQNLGNLTPGQTASASITFLDPNPASAQQLLRIRGTFDGTAAFGASRRP